MIREVETILFLPPLESGNERSQKILAREVAWGIRHHLGTLYIGRLAPTFMLIEADDGTIRVYMLKKDQEREVFSGNATKKEIIGGWQYTINIADGTTITLMI